MSDEKLERSEIPVDDERHQGRTARDPDPRPSGTSMDSERGVALSVLWWIEGEEGR